MIDAAALWLAWQLDTELTARHELQAESKKMEGDLKQQLQELSTEKEQLGSEKTEREKENQGLQGRISELNEQVRTSTLTRVTLTTHTGSDTHTLHLSHTELSHLLSSATCFLLQTHTQMCICVSPSDTYTHAH